MALAVYVDDVLLFGPSSEKMEKVIGELQSKGFELEVKKKANDKNFNFWGINIDKSVKEGSVSFKLT